MAEPMYRQIADDLRGKIDSGEIAHGAQLPTEIELMDEYSASRNTVRDAIKLLTTRGMVEPRPGQGTFVVQKINPFVTTLTGDPESGQGGGEGRIYVAEVEAGRRSPTVSDPRVEVQRANEAIADALRIKEGDQVVGRHYQRFIDGIPFSLQTSFYPMSLVLQGATRLIEATDIPEGTVVYLVRSARRQAGRLPRLDPGTAAGRSGGHVLPDPGRRPDPGLRDLPHRLRREWRPDPAHDHRLSGGSEPAADQRRRCPTTRERRHHEWRGVGGQGRGHPLRARLNAVTTLASAPAGSPSSPSIHPPLRSHPRYSTQGSANCGAMTETLRIRRATVDDMETIVAISSTMRAHGCPARAPTSGPDPGPTRQHATRGCFVT